MPKVARRQHFIARFYLRNFAEPLFSDNLCVFDLQKRRWERRTPDGIGWYPHLCSIVNDKGDRTDAFDRFLKVNVEDPATPALIKLASGGELDSAERTAVSLFIGLTAARSPENMTELINAHLAGLDDNSRAELDELVELWHKRIGKQLDSKSYIEFLKPSSFGGVWIWSRSFQRRLVRWEWHMVKTTRDRPFITSDRPVFAEWDRKSDMRVVGFPVSSEIALIIVDGGQFNGGHDSVSDVIAVNTQTMARANRFVVACKERFPGDDILVRYEEL